MNYIRKTIASLNNHFSTIKKVGGGGIQLLSTTMFILNHPLTRHNKLKAMAGFLRWQIGARVLRKKIIVPWVADSKFISGIGETGLTGNLYTGFMEYEDMLFVLHALQPDETFVDVGANVGAYTILASKVVGAKSISYEPLPNTVDRLKDQIQINRIDKLVSIQNKGVGESNGELFFTNNNNTINKVSLAGQTAQTTKVKVITLDGDLEKDRSYFFKIDVEGFEYNVIEGGRETLLSPQTSALIIELNGSGDAFGHSNEEIHKQLVSLNFMPVSYDPFNRLLKQLSSYNTNGGNTIYVKDINLINERVKFAPKRCCYTAGGIYI
jgi:FkbM family methyltransferase